MTSWRRGPNLLDARTPPDAGERFDTLAELARAGRVVIERIVSSELPEATLYDQTQDEWVALLGGEATLEIDGQRVALAAGDTLLIPAHTPHRVLSATAGALWLAVHVHPDR